MQKKKVEILSKDELLLKRLITEAQRHQSTQQYRLAIQAYTQVLDLIITGPVNDRRDIFLARSACYVAAGQPRDAVTDADAAIELDQDSCSAYYQKAEAYFSFGQFEQALVNYYAAYQKRPDIDKFRLGVQKAEKAILQAVQTCISGERVDLDFGYANPSAEQLKQSLLTNQTVNKQRCLCGCEGCDSRSCCDFLHESASCKCNCTACAHHNMYKHNLILDPVTNNYQEVSLACGIQVGASNSNTPVAGQARTQRVQTMPAVQKPNTKRVLNPLQEDKEFINGIISDQTLLNNENIQTLTKKSQDFIQTKNNFWDQQGEVFNRTTKKPLERKKTLPQKLPNLMVSQDLSGSQIQELDNRELLTRVLQKIQQSQQLLNQNQLTQALLIMQTVDKQAQQIQINENDDKNFALRNEKTKLMADAFTLIGSIYYRLNQLDLALQQFSQALDQAFLYTIMDSNQINRARKEEVQLYERQKLNQNALTVRALRSVYNICVEQRYFQRAIQCLEELRLMEYVPYLKAIDMFYLTHCYYSTNPDSEQLFESAVYTVEMIVGESVEFKMRKKYQINNLQHYDFLGIEQKLFEYCCLWYSRNFWRYIRYFIRGILSQQISSLIYQSQI
ncbi:Dynein_binding protein [Hexamita inflata]|uniref:Outer dynein arm-docking complex subunit 4 n=1 Tax=Hexamita inflata TaxID=28002 RepID=A0AA86UH77_9EUKA|nr:Dynein binding protein [Hexamita inflata]